VRIEREHKDTIVVQVEMGPIIALRLDGADFFCMVEKLLSFVQGCRKGWDVVAWKQISDIEYEAIDPKEGEDEAEDVDGRHLFEREDSQEWVGLSCDTELGGEAI
jgi:hypothetical protein